MLNRKKYFLFLMAILMVTISFAANKTFTKVDAAQTIMVNGLERQYWLYVPEGCPENAPMVVAMHGTTGKMTDKSPRFHDIADKEKFVVVYPQGLLRNFPVFGSDATGWAATGEYSEDVDFIRSLVETVGSEYTVDKKRIYCCGFSNGGMNTYSLTNFCSDIFAAFGSISGFPINEFHMHHVGSRPVPFIHIHGKADGFVKYSLVPTIIDNMVARNGANPVPVRTTVKGKYDKNIYQATEGGFPVVFYEVDGMGHNDFTSNTEDGNSSLTMWKFFKQHTLDSPCDTTLKWRPNIEADGYAPIQHGWKMGVGTTAYLFGNYQKTDANQNVYHSLQFVDGKYKLCFHIEGVSGTKVIVKLVKETGTKKVVVNATVTENGDVTLPFTVTGGWGEYQLGIFRRSKTDQVKVTKLAIYSVSDEESTAIGNVKMADAGGMEMARVYTLGGMEVNGIQSGLNIVMMKNGKVMKILRF